MKYIGTIILTLIAIGFIVLDRRIDEINKHLNLTASAVETLSTQLKGLAQDNGKLQYQLDVVSELQKAIK